MVLSRAPFGSVQPLDKGEFKSNSGYNYNTVQYIDNVNIKDNYL